MRENFAHCLVPFPLLKLALTGAVPCLLAPRAALLSLLSALGADRVVEEIIKHVVGIQLHHPLHILLSLCSIRCKESHFLFMGNFLPILIFMNTSAHLRDSLHYKRIRGTNVSGVPTQRHLFQCSMHVSKHGQLVNEYLIHEFTEAEEGVLTEGSDLVSTACRGGKENVVDSQPDLCLNLRQPLRLILRHVNPLTILPLLSLTFGVRAQPRLHFEHRHQSARNVVILDQLPDNRRWQLVHMVGDEADNAEAGHGCLVFDFECMSLQLLHLGLVHIGHGFFLFHEVLILAVCVD